jgi:hypothetical protein
MRTLVFLAALAVGSLTAADASLADRTITQVVDLLQGMLDKSKADGESDRLLWAKFKCYCDQTTDAKNGAVENYTATIEALTATITDRTAQSAQLEAEMATLAQDMNANLKVRTQANAERRLEHQHYERESADMQTGTDQLNRALDLLKAVDPLGAQSFLQTSDRRWDDVADALRAASDWVPIPAKKKRVLAAAHAARAKRAPAGGIAGVLKTFADTFVQNLASATAAEDVRQHDHEVLEAAQLADWNGLKDAKDAKEVTYGEHQSEIAKATLEKEAAEAAKAADEAFLVALDARCKTKGKEFEHRNRLRTQEDAAIAQAIAILNSDAAFGTFGKVSATSTGATSAFIQLDAVHYAKAAKSLARVAKKRHSLRLASLAARLTDGENVFDKVLSSINKTIDRIDQEEHADVTKKDWCAAEQASATNGKDAKETNLGTLEQTISNLETGIDDSLSSTTDAENSLATNRETQKEETETRAAEHAAYLVDLANLEEAERILNKAIEVLETYYSWLEAHNAPHHYDEKAGKGSMGGDMKRLPGASQEELEEACSADPGCKGFTSEGWLKSRLEEESDFFDTDANLYVKVFDRTAGHAALLQTSKGDGDEEIDVGTPDSWGDDVESEGQRGQGAEVLNMLRFILSETTKEKDQATTDENTSQGDFDSTIATLKTDENTLIDTLSTLALTLAGQRQSLEEAKEDQRGTTRDLEMIVKYLADIEPGCTFIQENYESRKQARMDEKAALQEAIAQVEATPAFSATTTAAP